MSSPVLQSPVSAEQPPPSPPVSPRRASFSSGVNGRSSSGSIRSRSGSSSRSTSFSLPNEAKGDLSLPARGIGPGDEEVEEEEEMDEEGRLRSHIHNVKQLMAQISSVAAAKHAAFVKARGRHYSNEAEAMKVCILITYPNLGDSEPIMLAGTSTHGRRRRNLQYGKGLGRCVDGRTSLTHQGQRCEA